MGTVGALIFFALVGAVICARSRSAAGAVVFSLLAMGLFVSTPVGAGLPGLMSDFVSAVSEASRSLTAGSGGVG